MTAAGVSGNTGVVTRDQESFSVPLCLRGENDPPPEELETALLAAARGFALGEETGAVARETGRSQEEIARWAFIYAKAWDRAWRPARLEAAEFGAALAINRLLDFAAGPDAALAARAARTLLVHRRHMHWGSARGDMRLPEWHPACPTGGDSLDETTPGGRKLTICQGGQKTSFSGKTQNGERFEGAGTYPPSLTRVSVAIGGDGSLTVAPGFAEATPDKRRSGPPRSCGAVRPSAWPRDGPG